MSNLESIVNNTKKLITKSYLKDEFKRIGIKEGDCLLVHSALSKLGFVCGGEVAVVEALIETVGKDGTIVMPTHSGEYVDPIFWGNPPVPSEWYEEIRKEMPAFNPDITPATGMGRIVECFRNFKGVKRSYHPTVSFAAFGKHAEFITKDHSLEYSLGENSPLAKFYELDGKVLLLGVDYDNNTSFHLSEYRAGNYAKAVSASPIIENGEKVFKTYEDIEFKTELFMFVGERFEEEYHVTIDKIGNADIKLFSQRDSVDFGVKYFKECTLY